LVIALEPRLWLAYLQTIFGQVTEARLMAKEALWPYLGNEMFMATSALSLVWLAALLLARPRLRRSVKQSLANGDHQYSAALKNSSTTPAMLTRTDRSPSWKRIPRPRAATSMTT
jgi:hypothetical protein